MESIESRDSRSIYASLPFVANGERIVYESDDSSQAVQEVSEPVWDEVSVDVIACSTLDAFKRFADSKIDYIEKSETLPDKYERLKSEIQELSELTTKSSNECNQELVHKVDQLSQRLQELRVSRWDNSSALNDVFETLQTCGDSAEDNESNVKPNVKYELFWKPEHHKLTDSTKINSLEQRIKLIETAVGANQKQSLLLKDKNLTDLVQELSSKVAYLDQNHLEKIDNRLHSITDKLTQIAERKSQVQELEKTKKISELYELISKSEKSRTAVPNLLERLETLEELQEQAMQFSSAISYLDSLETQISESLKNNGKQLELVKEMFTKNVDSIKSILLDFDNRLQLIK